MRNEEAVISPSWSIHAGAGTSNYSFIWGMLGDNQAFNDMDAVDLADFRSQLHSSSNERSNHVQGYTDNRCQYRYRG